MTPTTPSPISHERAFHIALVLEMSELSDRNSPEDDPSAMVADSNEMAGCIERALERADLVLVPPTALTTGSAPVAAGPGTKQIADGLEACNWSGMPIGNKAIIRAAIGALRAVSGSDEYKIGYQEGHHQGYYDAVPSASPVVIRPVEFESALAELVNKIDTSLDSGDLLIDARRASAALDAILTKGDLVANAHDYFRDSPGRYENSVEFGIGWNACLDALGATRIALLAASMGGDPK